MSAKKVYCIFLLLFLLQFYFQGCAWNKSNPASGTAPQSTNTIQSPEPVDESLPRTAPEPEPQRWIPSEGQFPFPSKGVPVLYYHSIANLPGNELGVPPEKFAEQMKYLKDSGFTVISLDQLFSAYKGQSKLPEKPIALTFDDGYPDNFTTAYPILKQYNYTATFFVVTGYMEPDQGMMNWEQLKEMANYGMTIAAHTLTHAREKGLDKLTPEEQREEILGSKAALESKLGITTQYFCYPYGSFNKTTLEILKNNGFTLAVTITSGNVKQGDDLLLLKRIYVNGLKDINEFKRKLGE